MNYAERQHHNADGTPKKTYGSKRAAKDRIRDLRKRHCLTRRVEAYQCELCSGWHIGSMTEDRIRGHA